VRFVGAVAEVNMGVVELRFWVGTAAAIALAELEIILCLVRADRLARRRQQAVARSKLLGLLVQYGRMRMLRHVRRTGTRRRLWSARQRLWLYGRWAILVAAGIVCLSFTMVFVATIVILVFIPGAISMPTSRTASAGIWACIVGMAVAVAWYFAAGIRYAVRSGTTGKRDLPCLSVPGLGDDARVRLALRIFSQALLPYKLILAGLVALVLAETLAPGDPGAHVSWLHTNATRGASLAWFAMEGLVVLLGVTTVPFFRRLGVFDRLAANICWVLTSSASPRELRAVADAELVDPLGRKRPALAQLAVGLSDAARVLDARQSYGGAPGTTPHPVATTLRAASLRVREYLRNQESWAASVPDEVTQMLQHVVLVLAGPADVTAFQELRKLVQAFDADGNPAIELETAPPSRATIALYRIVGGVNNLVSTLAGLATLAALVIACILFALHRLNLSALAQFLR
jgi:hypothetical protein